MATSYKLHVHPIGRRFIVKNKLINMALPKIQCVLIRNMFVCVYKCSRSPRWRVQSREEMRSQGQIVVKNRLSPQQSPTMLSDKQSIQEVTHESPPHNSHVATLKLRGPPILPWKVYKRYIGKRLKRKKSKEMSFCDKRSTMLSLIKFP